MKSSHKVIFANISGAQFALKPERYIMDNRNVLLLQFVVMKQAKSNPMIKLTSDDLNTLIHNYFAEEDYPLSLEAIKKEASVILDVKYTLIDLVYYGAKYIYIKQHMHKTGCREIFCLSEDHRCKFAEIGDADGEIVAKNGELRESRQGQRSEDEKDTKKRKDVTCIHEKGLSEEDEEGHYLRAGRRKGQEGKKKQTEENRALFEQIKSIFKSSQKKKENANEVKSNDSEGDRSRRGACSAAHVQSRGLFGGDTNSAALCGSGHVQSRDFRNLQDCRDKYARTTPSDNVYDGLSHSTLPKEVFSYCSDSAQEFGMREKNAAPAEPKPQYHMEYDVIKLEEHFSRTSLCAWNNSKLLATAGSDGQLRVFLGQCILSKNVLSEVTALDFQGNVAACGCHNGDVVVFDIKTQEKQYFRNFQGRVNVVKVESKGVIAGSSDGCISVDNKTYQCGLGKVFDVEMIKGRIAVATESNILRIVSTPNDVIFDGAEKKHASALNAGRHENRYVHYEDALSSPAAHDAEGLENQWLSGGRCTDLVGHQGPVNSINHCGGYLASASDDSTVKIWNLRNMKEERSFNHNGEVFRVQAKNEKIYSCSSDGTLRVWSFDRQISKFSHEGGVLTFDKKTLVVSGSTDNTVRVWDERVGEVMRHQTKGPVYTVSFSHDEKLICVCSRNESPVVLDLRRV